ncbi:hypothetical protein Golomagni_05606, partial [Golovinomyces magnicellulatus]
IISSLNDYIPYLLAVDAGLSNYPHGGETINVVLKSAPSIEWRPTLSGDLVPGRERLRVKVTSLEYEIFFVLSTLAFSSVALSRNALQPLYSTTGDFLGTQERLNAVVTASKHLMEAASVYDYLAKRTEQITIVPPCADVSPSTARALASLALAEATLLAILKDDPYPAAVAQDRNKTDKEWMYKAPDIPKVRAHLYARLALAASEHAAKASSLLQAAGAGTSKINPALIKYLEDLRRTCKAKACRFFGIDAELGGETAEGIGWLQAGLRELGVEIPTAKKGLSLSRFKKDFTERREDKRVDKEAAWGSDGGKLEETRVIEMLSVQWNKVNDTMNTQPIPPINSLLSKMPSGREMHTIQPYAPPQLDPGILNAMRAPPEGDDDVGNEWSSDEETLNENGPVGAFPGTSADYSSGRATQNAYY